MHPTDETPTTYFYSIGPLIKDDRWDGAVAPGGTAAWIAPLPPAAPEVPDWANRLMSVEDAVRHLGGLGEDAIRVAIKNGEIPARKFGRKILILGPALWRLMNGEAV